MTTPTAATLAILIDEAAATHTRTDLEVLLDRAGLEPYTSGGANKKDLLRQAFKEARAAAEDGDTQALRALLACIKRFVETAVRDPEQAPTWFDELRHALLADGYELMWERAVEQSAWGDEVLEFTYKVHPTDAASVPLGSEISALEAELASRGYTTVLEYYRHAVDGLINHKYGSANGDLRTTLEDLVTRLAEDYTGFARPAKANTGTDAINHVIDHCHIPGRDGGAMLKGLWQMIQTNGPHPGQTDADEARWRMQMVTATARFLLRHFPAQP